MQSSYIGGVDEIDRRQNLFFQFRKKIPVNNNCTCFKIENSQGIELYSKC